MTVAIVDTPVDRPTTIARALRPDHTDEMQTTTTDDAIRTEIHRPTTSSLQSTADDYVVNLLVAERVDAIVDDRLTTETDTTDQSESDNQ